MKIRLALLLCLMLLVIIFGRVQGGYDPHQQSPDLQYNEAKTVYLGNLKRHENGVPPLRWNQQLTLAARWFSWDSVENRPPGFCGHQDTQGHWPDFRAREHGYLGFAGAENAFCGYISPEDAIQGWMNSPGHRANLLDPNSREVGLGYYRRASDGRGYITQDFGVDPAYAPVIISNEAISTTSPMVSLYIYDRSESGGFAGLSAATQMMVSNDACFTDATWEAYSARRSWVLASGQGWRSVYVQTRDVFSRTMTVSDTIHLGVNVPLNELGAAQMSTTQDQVTLYSLDNQNWAQVHFSLGWLADDTNETFKKWWGNGESVNDPKAWGGTAYRLDPGNGESFAWVYDTTFYKSIPMTAYFRLKVGDNTSEGDVARVAVLGGGIEYGPLILKGVDFAAANEYQEFALDFTFQDNPDEPFLFFEFWRIGEASVYIDAVSIFSEPQPIAATVVWSPPGGNYRGRGVWMRYIKDGQFSPIQQADTIPPLEVSPASLTFFADRDTVLPVASVLQVFQNCQTYSWEADSDVAWLQTQAVGDEVLVSVNPKDLAVGEYNGVVTISAPGVSPAAAPVRLKVVEKLASLYLPIVVK